MNAPRATLYYLHDPMCSWCYAFVPVWGRLREALPEGVEVRRVLGGLAPDNDAPMDEEMRAYLEANWRRIEERVPGIRFNFDYWRRRAPRRSTYPACRAVIAARAQGAEYDEAMTHAIQRAYYQGARNPSDRETLLALAGELGLDAERFRADLGSADTEAQLQRELALTRALGVEGFPSLVLEIDGGRWPVAVDYNDARTMLDTIEMVR